MLTPAVWKYEEIVQALTLFIDTIVKVEATNQIFVSSSSIENSNTKRILNAVASVIPILAATNSDSSEVKLIAKMVIELCTSIANVVDSSEVRAIIYQIIVIGLASERPSMIVLPCLVSLSLIEGDDRVKEVNRVLTGLLMNFKLTNVHILLDVFT